MRPIRSILPLICCGGSCLPAFCQIPLTLQCGSDATERGEVRRVQNRTAFEEGDVTRANNQRCVEIEADDDDAMTSKQSKYS